MLAIRKLFHSNFLLQLIWISPLVNLLYSDRKHIFGNSREGKICILKISRNIREQSMVRSFSFFFLSFSLLALFCPYAWELYVCLKINHLCLLHLQKKIYCCKICLVITLKFQYHMYLKAKPCTLSFLKDVTSPFKCKEKLWPCHSKSNWNKMVSYFSRQW